MRIGPWWFQPYTLRIILGVFAALIWVWWCAPQLGFARSEVITWLWGTVFAAIVCGRLGYVVGNRSYFAQNPQTVVRLRQVGGLNGSSAFMGGLCIAGAWALVTHRRFAEVLALLTPATLWVAGGAWWGCLDVGCAWGCEVPSFQAAKQWWVVQAPDIYHHIVSRYAVQSLGLILAVILGVLGAILKRKASLALCLYFLGSAGLTLLRADPVPRIGQMRIDFLQDVILALLLLWAVVNGGKIGKGPSIGLNLDVGDDRG